MAFCPADCADVTLTQNIAACDLDPRLDNLSRIGLYTCDTTLPSPLTCMALEALVTAGKLAFTSPLANADLQDPSYAELVISDCIPALEIVDGRTIVFQDRVAIDKPADGTVSPVTAAEPYYNQRFWADKLSKNLSLRYLFIMCSGKVVNGLDENGVPMVATLRAFLKQENIGSAATPRYIQYVQGQLAFKGDPLALANLPEENSDNTNFDINACSLF